jgi:hypothetical protein
MASSLFRRDLSIMPRRPTRWVGTAGSLPFSGDLAGTMAIDITMAGTLALERNLQGYLDILVSLTGTLDGSTGTINVSHTESVTATDTPTALLIALVMLSEWVVATESFQTITDVPVILVEGASAADAWMSTLSATVSLTESVCPT